jgi:hypothetical protein
MRDPFAALDVGNLNLVARSRGLDEHDLAGR